MDRAPRGFPGASGRCHRRKGSQNRHPMIRNHLRILLSVAAMCLSLAAFGQIELPRLTEVVEVRVTNIDVIVTDDRGARVHGLTMNDFEVYDGGVAQEITNFSEITAPPVAPREAAAAATASQVTSVDDLPPRHIVVFFDNVSTSTQERRRVATAVAELFRDLRPVDDAMIVSWNRSIKIVVPPTSDHAALEAGLIKAARELSLRGPALTMFDARDPQTTQGQRAAEITAAARRRIREAAADQIGSVEGLNAILSRLAGLDGRKALILISSAFSFRPGAENAPPGEEGMLMDLEDVRAPDLLRSLTETANAAGISIYSMHAAGLQSGMSVTDTSPDQMLARMRSRGSSIDGLTYLAARTGGLVAANTNGFARTVARISEDLSSYYSIGYRSPVARNDQERQIKVVARNRKYTVRARRGDVARSFQTEIRDRVVAALLFSSQSNQLGITANVIRADRRKRNQLSIPVDVTIPMSGLTFSSDEQGLAADISIFIASADKSGSISTVEQFRQRIPVTREQLPTLGKMHFTYGLMVDLRTVSAENRLAIAVLDNIAKTTGLTTVDVTAVR